MFGVASGTSKAVLGGGRAVRTVDVSVEDNLSVNSSR